MSNFSQIEMFIEEEEEEEVQSNISSISRNSNTSQEPETVKEEPTHYIIYVGDGKNFRNSSHRGIMGLNSKSPHVQNFKKVAKKGQLIWFIQCRANGKVLAVATFSSCEKRKNDLWDDECLGWKGGERYDILIHYEKLYKLDTIPQPLLTQIDGLNNPSVVRKYESSKCAVDLPKEYEIIVRHHHPVDKM